MLFLSGSTVKVHRTLVLFLSGSVVKVHRTLMLFLSGFAVKVDPAQGRNCSITLTRCTNKQGSDSSTTRLILE